jgi:hypothetical protein
MSKETRKEFWDRMRFKYRLSFLNENTLEEVFAFHMSRLSGFITVLLFALALIALSVVMITKTPVRNYMPGYINAEIREEMIRNALATDSLDMEMEIHKRYLENIRAILSGDIRVEEVQMLDSIREIQGTDLEKSDLGKSKATLEFIKTYEQEEKYSIEGLPLRNDEKPIFYKPVKGEVSARFNPQIKHFGVDIASLPRESVLAAMRGVVIFTGFDPNAGHVIHIQHPNGFVSVYKHNARILKEQGDNVAGGDIIAVVGNTGSLSTGIHLHFELWYEGRPVDPTEYILSK